MANDLNTAREEGFDKYWVARTEVDSLLFKLECFIDHATGGKLSKSSWALETLKAAHDEYVKAREDAALAEMAEESPTAPPDRDAMGRLVVEASGGEDSPGFTTKYPLLNELLQETWWLGRGPNNHDTGMAWFESLARFLESLASREEAPAPQQSASTKGAPELAGLHGFLLSCAAKADGRRDAQVIRDWAREITTLATPAPSPLIDAVYVDSTPHLYVSNSAFEDWYQNYLPNSVGHKQIARDAYAAGMGDPLVMARTSAPSPLDDLEFGATPAPTRKNPCKDCGGTGMDGDVGEQGQAITINCSACHGSGEQAVQAPLAETGEAVAKVIYEQWADRPGYVTWVDGGNSLKQDDARAIARAAVTAAQPADGKGEGA